MPIRFRCEHCQQLMGIARRKAGSRVNCPTCGLSVTVPSADAADADARDKPNPAAPAAAGAPAAGGVPPGTVFERSDFDHLLGEGDQPAQAAARKAPAPAPERKAQAAAAAPVKAPATRRGGVDVEPVAAPSSAAWPASAPALVLSQQQVTILSVLAVVLLALAFAGGVLVGRFVL
jgi:hypothetical protein